MRTLTYLVGLSFLAVACGDDSGSDAGQPGGWTSTGGTGGGIGTTGGAPGAGGVGGAPIGSGGVPIGAGGVPIGAGGAPIGAGGAPIGAGGAPIGAGGAPIGSGGAPIGSGGAPIGSGGAPIGAGGAPIGAGGAPVGSGGDVTGAGGDVTGAGGDVTGAGGDVTGAGGDVTGAGGDVTGTGGDEGTGGDGTGGAIDEPTLITSGENNYWVEGDVTVGSGNANITVNEGQTYQTWLGLGGTFNEAGWVALQALGASERDRAIRLLFDVTDGIGFTYGRIPIGASDYAVDRYTLNETSGDTAMNSFSISRDQQRLIPYVQAALAVKGDIQFWASPWTPPTWMKDASPAGGSGFDGGVMRNDASTFQALALYFTRFVEAYAGEGIDIQAVMPQNEPGYTQHYPTCGWGAYRDLDDNAVNGSVYFGTFIHDYLAPAMNPLGVDIWCGTLSNDATAQTYWNDANSIAGGDIVGGALQWNNVPLVSTIANSGKLVMQSEHQCGNYPWLGSTATSRADANRDNFLPNMAPNNHAYGEESWDLITNWVEAGVNIYSAWNMVLDTIGMNLDQTRAWPQNALLAVDTNSGTLEVTPAYYVFRHIGQYVEPNAVRLGTQGGDALAFRNPDGSIVTIMYNSGGSAAQTTLSVGGQSLQFQIPAHGWATVNWQG